MQDVNSEAKTAMRVGVYVDAFNLYYGARDWCGKGEPGWRWLDVIGLVEGRIDAAVVISNDGDLRFALEAARRRVPIGLVNPGTKPTVIALKSEKPMSSMHWWMRLDASAYLRNQFEPRLDLPTKPFGW